MAGGRESGDKPCGQLKNQSAVYCVIGNIPLELHSADLRAFFSQMTELGGFQCFHFRHRPEINPLSNDKATSSATSSSPSAPATCCCVVGVKPGHLVDLLRNYDKKLWVNRAGKYLRSRVRISELKVTSNSNGESEEGSTSRMTSSAEAPTRAESPVVSNPDRTGAASGSSIAMPTGRLAQRGIGDRPSQSTAMATTACNTSTAEGTDRCGNDRDADCTSAESRNHGLSMRSCSDASDPTPSRHSQIANTVANPSAATDSHTNTADGATTEAGAVEVGDDEDSLDLERLLKLPELRPPSVLPNGNVGTPNTVLMDLIAKCQFPPRLIPKLGLHFPKIKKPHRYASVPFEYASLPRGKSRGSQVARSGNAPLAPASSTVPFRGPWLTADGHDLRGDDPKDATSGRDDTVGASCHGEHGVAEPKADGDKRERCDARKPHHRRVDKNDGDDVDDRAPSDGDDGGDGAEDDRDDDHDAEEWDRYEALYDDVDKQGRTEERLFENEIELKWEKGGSGLVFYTDAAYWDDLKGEEDERLADEYDVDMSIFYDPNSGTKDANDVMDMDMERRRRQGQDVHDWRSQHGFEKHTKGFGGRVLRDQGWKQGTGLGKREQGIAEPVQADGQVAYDKRGLGFFGEKLRRDVSRARKAQRHVTTKYDAADYTDTMMRTRGPGVLPRHRRAGANDDAPAAKRPVNEEGNVAKVNN